jgi:hypothetical protein
MWINETHEVGLVVLFSPRFGQHSRSYLDETPLHWAAMYKRKAATFELLLSGADASLVDVDLVTARSLAQDPEIEGIYQMFEKGFACAYSDGGGHAEILIGASVHRSEGQGWFLSTLKLFGHFTKAAAAFTQGRSRGRACHAPGGRSHWW